MSMLHLVVLLCLTLLGLYYPAHAENEINKYKLDEEKLIQSVNELRGHMVALQQEIAYIRRKSKHSYDILKRLEAGKYSEDCTPTTGKKKRQRNHAAITISVQADCPPEFPLQTHNSCYRIEPSKTTWEKARAGCLAMNSHLIAIETDIEHSFLLDHINTQKGIQHCDFWTGGTDKVSEGHWVWNHTADPLTFTNWHTWEPNNGGGREHCLWLDWYFSWEWNDATCNRQRACAICEIDRNIR